MVTSWPSWPARRRRSARPGRSRRRRPSCRSAARRSAWHGRGARGPSRRRSAPGSRWPPACPSWPRTQTLSHCVSCGQTRPVMPGRALSPSRTVGGRRQVALGDGVEELAGCRPRPGSRRRTWGPCTGGSARPRAGRAPREAEVDLVEVARRGRAASCSGIVCRLMASCRSLVGGSRRWVTAGSRGVAVGRCCCIRPTPACVRPRSARGAGCSNSR